VTAIDWLLDSDPAIRWQVMRDLTDAPPELVAAERGRIAREGWGARLLDLQGEDGQWAGGACFPSKSIYQSVKNLGQPWISTLPTLQLLHDFGIDPHSEGDSRPSRWNTLRALRVLRWYDQTAQAQKMA
jgi:hypothetical protein